MSKSPQARADRVEGQENGAIHSFTSGRLTSVNGTVVSSFVAPCDGYVTGFDVNIDTAFTNAAAEVTFGTRADPDSHLDDPGIQNLTGYQNMIDNPSGADGWLSKAIVKGEVYSMGFINADATGNGTITITIAANPGLLA